MFLVSLYWNPKGFLFYSIFGRDMNDLMRYPFETISKSFYSALPFCLFMSFALSVLCSLYLSYRKRNFLRQLLTNLNELQELAKKFGDILLIFKLPEGLLVKVAVAVRWKWYFQFYMGILSSRSTTQMAFSGFRNTTQMDALVFCNY